LVAEREGFEPPLVLPKTVFKTAAFNHSATSPINYCLISFSLWEKVFRPLVSERMWAILFQMLLKMFGWNDPNR
jgi:hypothetical protein